MQFLLRRFTQVAATKNFQLTAVPQRQFFSSFFKSRSQKFTEKLASAEASLKAGEFQNAVELFDDALKLDDPKQSKAEYLINQMAVAYGSMNKINKSIECYMKLQQLNPNDQHVKVAVGLLYGKSQSPEKALQIFEEVLSQDPKNWELTNQVALYCEQLGLLNKAIELYQAIIEAKQNNPNPYIRIGYIQVRNLKDNVKGLEYLLKAEKLSEENVDLVYNIGMSYYRMKNFPEAIKYLNKCLEIDPSFHDAKRNIKHIQSHIRPTGQ